MTSRFAAQLAMACVFCFVPSIFADTGPIRITLDNAFIDEYADRGTIKATFTIDKAHPRPNSPKKDGDMHIAGRAPEIGLPCVAELMNAKFEPEELSIVRNAAGTSNPVEITGAWRIWCEHAGTAPQKQKLNTIGTTAFTTTNPPHVFEIHPITAMDGESSRAGWRPIDGFQTKDAHDAFVTYENVACEIIPHETTTEIRTQMAGYNYVEFIFERDDAEGHVMQDGSKSLYGEIHDLEGDLLVRKVRAVFVTDTPPFEALSGLHNGEQIHVLGIPRLSLAIVKWRIEHQNDPEFPDALNWDLPYEILIVGIYPEDNE